MSTHSHKLTIRPSSIIIDGREVIPISRPQVLPPFPPKSPSHPSPLLHHHCCVLAKAFTVFPLKPYGDLLLSYLSPGLPPISLLPFYSKRELSRTQLPPASSLASLPPISPHRCKKPEGFFSNTASSINLQFLLTVLVIFTVLAVLPSSQDAISTPVSPL